MSSVETRPQGGVICVIPRHVSHSSYPVSMCLESHGQVGIRATPLVTQDAGDDPGSRVRQSLLRGELWDVFMI